MGGTTKLSDLSQEDQVKAERLTESAESGDFYALYKELNDMTPQERLKFAQAMDDCNETRRGEDSSLPDLIIDDSNYELNDMKVRDAKHRDKDVYDRPQPLHGSEAAMDIFKVPGLDGSEWDIPLKRTNVVTDENGNATESFSGQLNDGSFWKGQYDTDVSIEVNRDADGHLTRLVVTYNPPKATLQVGGENQLYTLQNVDKLVYEMQGGKWVVNLPPQPGQGFDQITTDYDGSIEGMQKKPEVPAGDQEQ